MAVSTRGLGLSPGLTNWEELIRGWNHFERIPDVYVPFHPHILSGEADKAGGGARGKGFIFRVIWSRGSLRNSHCLLYWKIYHRTVQWNFLWSQKYSIAVLFSMVTTSHMCLLSPEMWPLKQSRVPRGYRLGQCRSTVFTRMEEI